MNLPAAAPPTDPAHTGHRVLVNTSALGGANAARIAVSFLIQVLVARRLGAAALGDYAVVMAWLNVGQVLSDGGLPGLAVREMAGRPALRRAWQRHMRVVCLALALLVWAVFVGLAALLPAMRPRLTLLLVGGGVLPLYALFAANTTLFEASERMDRILVVDVVANAALLAGVAATLWRGGGVTAVVWVVVAGQGLAALVAWLLVRRARLLASPQEEVVLAPSETLRRAAPFFGIATADVIQQRADLLLLSVVAPAGVVGIYAAASSLVRVGIRMVGAAWRALYPTLSRLRDAGAEGFARLDLLAVRALALLALPAAAIGAAVSGPLAVALFGPEYLASGRTLALLLWLVPLYAWEVRCATLLAAVRRPRDGLLAALAHVAGLALLLPPLALANGSDGAALAALAAGAAGAGMGTWMLARAGLTARGGALLRPALAALAGGATAWLLPLHWLGQAVGGVAAFIVSAWLLGAVAAADLKVLRRALRT